MGFAAHLKIGIIGGGQLGKMLTVEAKKFGFFVTVLDPTPDSPAGQVADRQIVGDLYDGEKIRATVLKSDITTYEIEHINTGVLKELEADGHRIYPSPGLLEIIQDKSAQKEVLIKNRIPTARWKKVEDSLESSVKELGFPVVQKACRGGYDGRGVFIIRDEGDLKDALQGETFLEEFVDFEKELAVMVARSENGDIKCYPVVEMSFDERANICDMVIAPARVSEKIKKEAEEIAVGCVEALDGVGIFGIEMFLAKDGRVLVNEIAPRPHNSGHYTIEACVTSQFEQHIRAITGLPLGSTDLLCPAVMVNILGEEGFEGPPAYTGVPDILSMPGVSLHIYGKKNTKPFRKMGHVTVIDMDLEKAIQKAERVKQTLQVISGVV
jgi:5-(carboxyamino)imidazole ribonucleotide synthase